MSASYLLRFDDFCPTMNWAIWDQVDAALREADVRPLLAVIPANEDPSFAFDEPRGDFWERVSAWQALGWTIALHGHRHLYSEADAGLWGSTPRSEFAGLPRTEQRAKIRAGLDVFAEHGVRADAWIAPNHSFDLTTIDVLRESGVRVISDSMAVFPYRDGDDMFWVPCQTWDFTPKRVGVWTVCMHPNNWNQQRLDRFRRQLDDYRERITDLDSVRVRYGDRHRSPVDVAYLGYRRMRSRLGSTAGAR